MFHQHRPTISQPSTPSCTQRDALMHSVTHSRWHTCDQVAPEGGTKCKQCIGLQPLTLKETIKPLMYMYIYIHIYNIYICIYIYINKGGLVLRALGPSGLSAIPVDFHSAYGLRPVASKTWIISAKNGICGNQNLQATRLHPVASKS